MSEQKNKVIQGDCLDVLKTLEENSIDSIVTDSPYELGFMGKYWDNTGIANNPEMWKECLRVLKSGGYLLSFGGTRTYHRMASAIEDAGFEVRDMVEWVYGSGFPKSLNIGKAVDKLQGNEREVTGKSDNGIAGGSGEFTQGNPKSARFKAEFDITKGTSEWEGWGTALKPAHEPICMARKPLLEKTVAENVLKYGTGGINIDESRVGTEDTRQKTGGAIEGSGWGTKGGAIAGSELGRFPANLIHDNSEEVRECFPDKSERFFKSILYVPKASKSERNKGCEELEEKPKVFNGQSDKPSNDMKDVEKRFTTLPKANNHPTVKPIALMEYLIKMVTPKGGIVLDPFAGSGTTAVATINTNRNFIAIEMDADYCEIARKRINEALKNKAEKLMDK